MKMTVVEAQENLEACRQKMTDLKRQFDAEMQKSIFLQGYIQALSGDDDDSLTNEEPTPLRAVETGD